jgi:hypothetical protein
VSGTPIRPAITVAVPTCNGAGHIGPAIRSILAQESVEFDLVISDDRSDDDTLSTIRAIAGDRARIYVNSERLGLAGNWNRCAALASAPVVCIFHQDDVMLGGHLHAHASAFASHPSLGLAASASVMIDELGSAVASTVVDPGGLGPLDQTFGAGQLAPLMAAGNPLRCSAISLRIDALNRAGGFDPSLRYVVDWDCWLRIARQFPVAWIARPTVQVRWHSASETHRFKTGTSDLDETARMLDILFEIDLKHDVNAAPLHTAAREKLGRAYLNRAHDALRAGQADLAKCALDAAIKIAPALRTIIARDPRLLFPMMFLKVAPDLAAALFRRATP